MIGKSLAHYEITGLLGKGGMGEVYLARDPQLERDVAIKILPREVADDPERLARFEKEARALAAVSHPGIATVFGLHQDDGTRFMAMELVPGEDLQHKAAGRRISITNALELAAQIAEALEAAHALGIVHRDLKPQNVMVTPTGSVKILDFGLARLVTTARSGDPDQETGSMLTAALTAPGTVLGTPAYMSPEQVHGEPVDTRADVWALGVILYELLAGGAPFGGKSVNEIMYRVSQTEPDWTRLPDDTPREVRSLVRRCLVKDANRRLQAIGDARVVIREVLAGVDSDVPERIPGARRRWQGLVSWLLLPVVALAVWQLVPRTQAPPRPGSRYEISAPTGLRIVTKYQHGLALSPDGKELAFVAGTAGDPLDPTGAETALYVRNLDQWESRRIAGTEGASQPFFSPDGQWLGFNQDGELKKVRSAGGDIQTVYTGIADFGASWAPDGRIVFAMFARGGLGVVPANGGPADTLTVPDRTSAERYHRLPHVLPGGRALLFTAMDAGTWMTYDDAVRIKVLDLETGASKTLIRGGTDARYVDTGHLVFAREGGLFAVPFDLASLEVTGEEFPMLEGVSHSIHAGNTVREVGAAQFSLSTGGTLAYLRGSIFPERLRAVVWIDRDGREEPLPIDPKQYVCASLSPDERSVLLATNYPPYHVWRYDLARKTLRRQTFSGTNYSVTWGPDADHFTMTTYRDERFKLVTKRIDSGADELQEIPGALRHWASTWDVQGRTLLTLNWAGDIWSFSADGANQPVLQNDFIHRDPVLSPNNRWLLYSSDESGRREVYVRTYPALGPSHQVSVEGGYCANWSPDGDEICFWSAFDDLSTLTAVSFRADGDVVTLGQPLALFETDIELLNPTLNYSIAADGRFLVVKAPSDSNVAAITESIYPDRIRIVQNWTTALEKATEGP